MPKQVKLIAALVLVLLLGCSINEETVFSWVDRNDAKRVEQWLEAGGDPDLKDGEGRSLLYIAAGPHGGRDVLRVLIEHGARVDGGAGRYTPLMNAASWSDDEAVMALLGAGADPCLRNESGGRAVEVIGKGDAEADRRTREALLRAMSGRCEAPPNKGDAADRE